jgi:hypothetical protein
MNLDALDLEEQLDLWQFCYNWPVIRFEKSGVVGYKLTYGLISRRGMLPDAWSLDTVGVRICTHCFGCSDVCTSPVGL